LFLRSWVTDSFNNMFMELHMTMRLNGVEGRHQTRVGSEGTHSQCPLIVHGKGPDKEGLKSVSV
jgi:hypothetical protein